MPSRKFERKGRRTMDTEIDGVNLYFTRNHRAKLSPACLASPAYQFSPVQLARTRAILRLSRDIINTDQQSFFQS
jgi:hypothetical protein